MSNAFDKASLVMLPHAYEEGKLYSLKPTDRSGDFTFSRGTDTATRVNEQGYIEKETVNLLEQSNTFSDSSWLKATITPSGGEIGYDGSNDAWRLTADSTSSSARIENSISSNICTYSVYAKEGNTSSIGLRSNDSTTITWFDLSGSGSLTQGSNAVDASMINIGNGWFRLSIVFSSVTSVRFYVSDNAGGYSVTGGKYLYIQDAMVNPGLVAQPYLETTTVPVYGGLTDNMPRLDYTDASCPSLLLEPSRTNLVPNSEYGYVSNNTSLDYNNETSPEGVQNALKVTATNTAPVFIRTGTVTTTAASTFSAFVKYGNNEWVHFINSGDGTAFFNFNCQTGEFGTSGSSTSNLNAENYGNGWWRVSGTFGFIGAGSLRIYLASNSSTGFGGASTTIGNYFYSYGWQYEEGSYPTSYIPTYGSTQTRARDSSTVSVTNTTSRTYFLDGTRLADEGTNNTSPIYQPNDNLGITFWNLNRFRFRFGGAINYYYTLTGDDFKIALSYNGTDTDIYINGQYYITQSSFDLGDVSALSINGNEGISYNQLLLFPTALSDSECIALTTL